MGVWSQGSEEVFAIDPLPPRPASVDSTRDNIALLPRSPPHPHPLVPAHQDDEDAEGVAHEVRISVCVGGGGGGGVVVWGVCCLCA